MLTTAASRSLLLAAVLSLPAWSQLAVVQAALHQFEGGPALGAGFRFVRGETVFLSFRIQGYQTSEAGLHLSYAIEAVDPRGIRLVEPAQQEIQSELAPEDKDWLPVVRHQFQIPPLAEPGACRILVRLEDKLAGREAKAEIPFQVRAPLVEPSETLVARNFRFLRGEDGPEIEGPAVYHRGEMLWARFDITGYKLGDKNHIRIEYGLSVLGPTGKVLYSEPQAAVEESTPFYPNRYVHGMLSLNLEKAQPGEYTILLALRDQVGNQTA
ncbi:MAG: hypothetical protein AAB225_29300, partial [Acidobacteriota bacterium]